MLGRIAERDMDYLSFYAVLTERALDAARRADAGAGGGSGIAARSMASPSASRT